MEPVSIAVAVTNKLPAPYHFHTLLVPARSYLSFKREGRVIERILEDLCSSGKVVGVATASVAVTNTAPSPMLSASPSNSLKYTHREKTDAGNVFVLPEDVNTPPVSAAAVTMDCKPDL